MNHASTFAVKVNEKSDYSLPNFHFVCSKCVFKEGVKFLTADFDKREFQATPNGNVLIGVYNEGTNLLTITGQLDYFGEIFFP